MQGQGFSRRCCVVIILAVLKRRLEKKAMTNFCMASIEKRISVEDLDEL